MQPNCVLLSDFIYDKAIRMVFEDFINSWRCFGMQKSLKCITIANVGDVFTRWVISGYALLCCTACLLLNCSGDGDSPDSPLEPTEVAEHSRTEHLGTDQVSEVGIPTSAVGEPMGGARRPQVEQTAGQLGLSVLPPPPDASDVIRSDGGDIAMAATEVTVFDAGNADGDAQEDFLDGLNIYFGNFHSHTDYSDGTNTPAEAFAWARDEIGFDFFAITDHAFALDQNEWEDTGDQAEAYSQEGVFLALRGFEYTNNTSGHINVFLTDEFASVTRFPFLLFLYFWLDVVDGFAQFNHPGRQPTVFDGFQYHDRLKDNVVLIETANKTITNTGGSYLDYYTLCLDRGWRVAPASGQDNHTLSATNIRSAYIGERLSYDALVDAMRNRRIYSSDDPNAEIVFKHGDSFMGSVVRPTGLFTQFTVWVRDDEPIQQLQLITNSGRVADEISYTEETTEVVWRPWAFLFGRDYFFLKVIGTNNLDDGDDLQTAVTAPIWIDHST